jgi:GNAT superfamily N-acetyltransferase
MIRRARLDEAGAVAKAWIRARDAAFPAVPRRVHSDDEVLQWFETVVFPATGVWVAADGDGETVGVTVLADGWLEQLYIVPEWTAAGLGSRMLSVAKEQNPSGLMLWTFQSNMGARRFYERHGFTAVEETEGSSNEEGAPDVRYHWPRHEAG